MTNQLPNESELFENLSKGKVILGTEVIDFLFHYIGNDLSAINLLCEYYLGNNESIPELEARRLLFYTHDIEFIINALTRKASHSTLFPEFKEDISLNPLLRDLITYYFGNDLYVINLIIYDALDPIAPQPHYLNSDAINKVLNHSNSIKGFMEKLRSYTAN